MNLDLIANNLANVNTTGFKKSKIEFQDLLYQNKKAEGAEAGDGNMTPSGIQIGHGSRPISTTKILLMAIWLKQVSKLIWLFMVTVFEVQMPGGQQGYTRDGSFKVSADGAVVTGEGYPLNIGLDNIPAEAINIGIASTGEYTFFNQQGQNIGNGNIQLTRFINASGLQNIGRNIVY